MGKLEYILELEALSLLGHSQLSNLVYLLQEFKDTLLELSLLVQDTELVLVLVMELGLAMELELAMEWEQAMESELGMELELAMVTMLATVMVLAMVPVMEQSLLLPTLVILLLEDINKHCKFFCN